MRVKRCFCISNQTGGSIQLFIKNASPLVHLYNVYFSAAIPMASQWLQEVVVYLELAGAVGGNLQKRFPLLPSTPLTLVGQSLGACLQRTAKYGTEIPSRCIHAALLGKERRIMRSESSVATFDIAVPDLVNSVFHRYSLFGQGLRWNCTAPGSEAATNTAISRRSVSHSIALCRHASGPPEPWNPTCKSGTMVWPIKHTDAVSNTFWQYCKVSLELSRVMRARWIMQMFERSCKTAQSLNLFPQSQWILLKASLIFPSSKVSQGHRWCQVPPRALTNLNIPEDPHLGPLSTLPTCCWQDQWL